MHLSVQIFERETNREKNLEKAVKEAKVKARKEAAKTSDTDKDRAMDEQDILKVCTVLCCQVWHAINTVFCSGSWHDTCNFDVSP